MENQEKANTPETVNILVVDDHVHNRSALRAILPEPQYRLVEAECGAEALRRLLDEEFAVLLIDVVMPDMNGFELASTIKLRERAASVPIIFLTAEATDVELVFEGYRVGAVDYLVKPLVPNMVRAKVAVFRDLFRQRKHIEGQAALLVESEQRRNELKLMELRLASERRYRELAETVPDIVWTARPDGTVDYFNQRWFGYTGLSAAETGQSWYGAIDPGDVDKCRNAWKKANESGQPCEVEVRLRSAGGTYRWHLGRAVPECGIGGNITSWLGTFTDIEAQKQAQAVLSEFKGTLDSVLDAIVIVHPTTWRVQYANHGACVLLGYSLEELCEMSLVSVMVDYDESSFRDLLGPLSEEPRPAITIETKYRRKDRRIVPVELSLQRIQIDGQRIVSITRDITERKHAELEREILYREAVDAVRTRDEFLSIASHELKTPLSSLRLQIEMLKRKAPAGFSAAQVDEKLTIAVRQVDRLARLVGQLMDVSRIAAGRLRLEPEEVDLAALVRDVAARFADEAARAGSEIVVKSDAPVVGRWDRLCLEQVVTNLLANALKFGANSPIDVSAEGDESLARIVVKDRGIGIDPRDVDRIFGRYERAVSARAFGGFGLGLFIVHQIVEAHGGTIQVQSTQGAGATFTVELPPEIPALHSEDDVPRQIQQDAQHEGAGR